MPSFLSPAANLAKEPSNFQLKHVFRLEENVQLMCHDTKLTNSLGKVKLTNSLLARDQVGLLEAAANLRASKFVSRKKRRFLRIFF